MTKLSVDGIANINDLPFGQDRSRAWRELHSTGEAVLSGDEIVLTSAEAVEFAAKRPELFSSAKAFDKLGSPVPLIPIAIDPPDHTRFRRMLDPFFSPKKMMLQARLSESCVPKSASGKPAASKLPAIRQTSQAEIAMRK